MVSLERIAVSKELRRADVMDALRMSKSEWDEVKGDATVMRKAQALYHFAQLYRTGEHSAEDAYKLAASAVAKPRTHSTLDKHINWQTLKRWRREFVQNDGRFELEKRGHNVSGPESFLKDEGVKEAAREWIRNEIRNARRKGAEAVNAAPPLTVDRFHAHVNDVLLKDAIAATTDAPRNPIDLSTARRWMARLGFDFRTHSKGMYYDGHERADVKADRAEKLVMLHVLDEVIVKFGGRDCDRVVWPILHPGESPVVVVSQDECAFHGNDDRAGEWGEVGKGGAPKAKGRGALIMVSMFISELLGRIRASREQLCAYAAAHPTSHLAQKVAQEPTWNGDSVLVL